MRTSFLLIALAAVILASGCSNKHFSGDVEDFIRDHAVASKDAAQKSYDQTTRLNDALRKAETTIVTTNVNEALAAAYDENLPVAERIEGAFKAGQYKAEAEADIADAKRVEITTAQNLLDARAELDNWLKELADAYDARDAARKKLAKESIVKAQQVVTQALSEWEALEQRKALEAEIEAKTKANAELQAMFDAAKAEAEAKEAEAAHAAPAPIQ